MKRGPIRAWTASTHERTHSAGRNRISVDSMITGKFPTFIIVRIPPCSIAAPATAIIRVIRDGMIESGRNTSSTTSVPQLMRWTTIMFVASGYAHDRPKVCSSCSA